MLKYLGGPKAVHSICVFEL